MTQVLLVEDDIWLAESMKTGLEKEGYHVTHAVDPYAAIDIVTQATPEVIVVDMLLTGSTGIGLLQELQSYTDTKNIPIIMCTNVADALSITDLQPYGVRSLIDKTTMHPSDLAAAVRAVTL